MRLLLCLMRCSLVFGCQSAQTSNHSSARNPSATTFPGCKSFLNTSAAHVAQKDLPAPTKVFTCKVWHAPRTNDVTTIDHGRFVIIRRLEGTWEAVVTIELSSEEVVVGSPKTRVEVFARVVELAPRVMGYIVTTSETANDQTISETMSGRVALYLENASEGPAITCAKRETSDDSAGTHKLSDCAIRMTTSQSNGYQDIDVTETTIFSNAHVPREDFEQANTRRYRWNGHAYDAP